MVHLILCLSVLFGFVAQKVKAIRFVPFTILFIFAAIRYEYGNDYNSYYRCYENIQNSTSTPFKAEPFFTELNRLCPSYYLMVALCSLFFVLVIYWLITEYLDGKHIGLGLFILVVNPYVFLMFLSALRQSISVSLFLLAISFAEKRKFLPYVLLIVVAALFHKSAWILLPVYFFANNKPFRPVEQILVLFAVAVLLFLVDIPAVAVRFAEWFNDSNYVRYIENAHTNSLRATLLTGVYFAYVLLNLPRLKGRTLLFAKIYLIGTVFGILAYRLAMLTRPQMFFDIAGVIALPRIYYDIAQDRPIKVNPRVPALALVELANQYLFPFVILTIYLLRYYSFFTNPAWKAFYHYQTIFSIW